MVPLPVPIRNFLSIQYVLRFLGRYLSDSSSHHHQRFRRAEIDRDSTKFIVFACLIPCLVLLSGLFAGLTLGYMSLDETQLNVLSISGTPEQRKYAKKIMPVRKNGHLLLVTLLLANMIVNESLPVIADPVLGGGVQGVIVSTALIVVFAEIIPQSLFTRHGLYLGAKMATFTQILIYAIGIISWPVAKLLEFVLGPHHGIIYRRAELKELIAMHSSQGAHGGDLKTDTVTIIGATLDLQEKVVKQAMTPIENVFMLSIDSKLDYDLLKQICQTGHSRVPVYEEVEVPMGAVLRPEDSAYYEKKGQRTVKVKKIIGILLVKQCVLLDPKDATPLRKIPLNKVPFVPNNEPLLGILDKFQEGGSHMAIVSRFSVEKAASMKKAVKRGLTQRLRARVRLGDTDSETESSSEEEKEFNTNQKKRRRGKFMNALRLKESNENIDLEGASEKPEGDNISMDEEEKKTQVKKVEAEVLAQDDQQKKVESEEAPKKEEGKKSRIHGFQLPKLGAGMTSMSMLEQSMPADAVLTKESAAEFLQGWDPAVMPLGIITLEDVLEELIGEEIYDEFDIQGFAPVHIQDMKEEKLQSQSQSHLVVPQHAAKPEAKEGSHGRMAGLKTLGFFRTRSAPPVSRRDPPNNNIPAESGDAGRGEGGGSGEGETGTGPTILMPRPVPDMSGRNLPSIILERHSTQSSIETGLSGTLVTETPGGGLARKPSAERGRPQVLSGPSISFHSSPTKATRSSSPTPSVPVLTLEAVLLDRKRRMTAAHGAGASGSGFITTPSSSPGVTATTAMTNSPGSSPLPPPPPPPIFLSKDFGLSSSVSTSPASSVLGTPSLGGQQVVGKGAKFKSSPLGGSGGSSGSIRGGGVVKDVVAEKVGSAYIPMILGVREEQKKSAENSKEMEGSGEKDSQ